MVRSVRDGLYVSNGRATYYLPGNDASELSLVKVDDEPAIFGTDVKVDGEIVGRNLPPGPAVLWLTKSGLAVGLPEGKMFKATQKSYCPTVPFAGSSIVGKNRLGFYQYIASQQSFPDVLVDTGNGFSSLGSMEATRP